MAPTVAAAPESPSKFDHGQRGHTATQPSALVPREPLHDEVPNAGRTSVGTKASQRRQSGLLNRRRSVSFGSIQPEFVASGNSSRPTSSLPRGWRGPNIDGVTIGKCIERSELGVEVSVEILRWLNGETTGPQCSQAVLDRALTVLANFKLSSGCELEVLGGPLGAIVGGFFEADWLFDEVFQYEPADAVRSAFALLGFKGRGETDFSNVAAEEISLAYRRLCLRGHPSRGGAPRNYLKLQVAMELIRAVSGEAGLLDNSPRTPQACARKVSFSEHATFVLDDVALVRELQLTPQQAEEEAKNLSPERLEEMNRALDEYILRQMCFKSEIVDEIARLHENSAYAILGISSDATDGEIKKAYRIIAMQCHPDKGGDKEDFQELHNAYEKIMDQRKAMKKATCSKGSTSNFDNDSDAEDLDSAQPKRDKAGCDGGSKNGTSGNDADAEGSGKCEGAKAERPEDEDGTQSEDGDPSSGEDAFSNASLIEKASKAAEETSRYAKTAAEFAHQAAEAAEKARRSKERGDRNMLIKSTAHSAIVLTLTVVKAVRVVGYATLDVAAQCRVAAKRNSEATSCAEQAVSAMGLGLEALNSALACAEVTETTAAELQASAPVHGSQDADAAERFVGAAVRASLAAASASNAAMAAAIAAVEGSRACTQALEAQRAPQSGEGKKSEKRRKWSDGSADVDVSSEDGDGSEPEESRDREAEARKDSERKASPLPTLEEAAASSLRRLVAQRNNNHKVLQRLNAEILGHQQNVRQFLQQNRALIPDVTAQSKRQIFELLTGYTAEACEELKILLADWDSSAHRREELLVAFRELNLFLPFLQSQALAISVSVKARVLKMAALYDVCRTLSIIEDGLFQPVRHGLPQEDAETRRRLHELSAHICDELRLKVAEESAADGG